MSNVIVIQERRHMATTFSFRISCAASRVPEARQVLDEAHFLVSGLEDALTEFREPSPVYRFNSLAPGGSVRFNSHAFHLLKLSERLWWHSKKSFNVLAKGSYIDFDGLELDENELTVRKLRDGVRLGFGAIGKGYALDRVRELIVRHDFQDYVLNAGGSSQIFSGFQDRDTPWTLGWSFSIDEDGEHLGIPFESEKGECFTLGVSGTQEQGEHILGRRAALKSVIALHSSAAFSDAVSTAVFAGGWDAVDDDYFKEEKPGIASIDQDDRPRWNGIFEKVLGPIRSAVLALLLCMGTVSAYAEEEIDLGDLGVDDFNPYLFDRNSLWILLPVAMAFFVIYHLKKVKKQNPNHEEEYDPSSSEAGSRASVISINRDGGSDRN